MPLYTFPRSGALPSKDSFALFRNSALPSFPPLDPILSFLQNPYHNPGQPRSEHASSSRFSTSKVRDVLHSPHSTLSHLQGQAHELGQVLERHEQRSAPDAPCPRVEGPLSSTTFQSRFSRRWRPARLSNYSSLTGKGELQLPKHRSNGWHATRSVEVCSPVDVRCGQAWEESKVLFESQVERDWKRGLTWSIVSKGVEEQEKGGKPAICSSEHTSLALTSAQC